MPIKYKIDILEALKEKGFTSYRIRKKNIRSKTLQDFRNGNVVLSADCLEKLCNILDCQIGDLIEYVSDENSIFHIRTADFLGESPKRWESGILGVDFPTLTYGKYFLFYYTAVKNSPHFPTFPPFALSE
ncbi:MAG: helix-turn-helix domain-containing protein [Eubacterium sp.]